MAAKTKEKTELKTHQPRANKCQTITQHSPGARALSRCRSIISKQYGSPGQGRLNLVPPQLLRLCDSVMLFFPHEE